jgi:polysulfide reductase chain C
MPENAWGWLIITYLFLAGAGAGAFLAAAAAKLLAPDWPEPISKIGSLISGPLVAIGTLCLVLDLEAGLWQPWRQIYLLSNFTSMITWGVLILSAFIPVAMLYAAAMNDLPVVGPFAKRHEGGLRFLGGVLAVLTAGYTGVLIAVIDGMPFWNSPALPLLFLASAVSTGLAITMIGAYLADPAAVKGMGNYSLGHIVFLMAEFVILTLFLFMSLTTSNESAASAGLLISGSFGSYFWILVVALGIVFPMILSLLEYAGRGELPKTLVVASEFLVLVGGMSLRALIILAGKGPTII